MTAELITTSSTEVFLIRFRTHIVRENSIYMALKCLKHLAGKVEEDIVFEMFIY